MAQVEIYKREHFEEAAFNRKVATEQILTQYKGTQAFRTKSEKKRAKRIRDEKR